MPDRSAAPDQPAAGAPAAPSAAPDPDGTASVAAGSPRWRRRTAVAAAVAVLAGGAVVATRTPSRAAVGVAYDRTTGHLDFVLPAFAGGVVSTASLAGKPAVVNFYASWCTFCRRELPDFQALHTALGDQVTFLGVNPQSGDSDAAQAAMIRRAGVTYPTLRDRHDTLLRTFDTSGALPLTLYVDAHGTVISVSLGRQSRAQVLDALAQFFGARPRAG